MRFADLVTAHAAVAATTKRTEKVAALAAALAELDPDEVAIGARYLAGEVRQDRLEVGWSTIRDLDVPPVGVPQLTVSEVDAALDAVAAPRGPGSRGARRTALEALWGRATATEQEMLGGLILGELRQGALAGVLTAAIAQAAGVPQTAVRRALMLSADLGEVAAAAQRGGAEALAAFRLALHTPVQPMLASTAASTGEALAGIDRAVVEWKLDGARVQIHRTAERVSVWTRTGKDATSRAGELIDVVEALDATSIVLDGEVIALRPDGRPHRFQDTMRRFGERGDPAAVDGRLAVFAFDCLHRDGVDLLDEPLEVRWEHLTAVVPPDLRIRREVIDSAESAETAATAALAAGHEGVMVKDLDAPYAAGRRGKAWRKVKPALTLDLVVLAAEWGSGRRRGKLSNLHLGARDGDGFVMLGKTFKGLTDEVLAWQTEALLARETRRDGHVVHVRPDLVVEVAIDGVQTSTRYPAGMALRFARVRAYREDKGPDEADDVATVRAIHARGA